MPPRDPRSFDPPTSPGDPGREPTESLSLGAEEHAALTDSGTESGELARGTHNRPVTALDAPLARSRTQLPGEPHAAQRGDEPARYLGQVLGSYRVQELLGKGGMGYVFRAEHVKLGREVALKLLRIDYASRRDAVARFFQEARTVNRVRHRNIVDVTDLVELDDGTTYIVMELLTGTSLGAWARTGVDLPRALAVLVQICDGLAAAHQVGVIHRDLKPDNVIIAPTSDGAELVKLLDFGVAKLLNRDDEDVGFQTAAGSVIGTPAYMSPEQAGGMVVDGRSDIYSLGAIMYELFSGQPMFRGRSFGEYVRKHLTEVPIPPRQTPGGSAIDPRVEAVILRCLDKDPDQRFARIGDLREALLQLLGSDDAGAAYPAVLPASGPHALYSALPPGMRLPAGGLPRSPGAPPSQTATAPGGSGLSSGPYPPAGTHPGIASGVRPGTVTPWWVWFLGGAVAVGVGITASLWYADRHEPRLIVRPGPAARAPTAQPIPATAPAPDPAPAAPAPRAPLEVRFESEPGSSVYADGKPTELCQTPCAFDIDTGDGGPMDHRGFVVRRAGYADSTVLVDLARADAPREFHMTLEPVAGEPVHRASRPRDRDAPEHHPSHKPARANRKASTSRDAADSASDPDAEPRPSTGAARASEDASEPARTAPRKPAPIDPADTLDPFHKK